MTQDVIHVVLIEDNPTDAKLVEISLEHYFKERLRLKSFDSLETGSEFIDNRGADVLLLDLELPDSDYDQTLDFIKSINRELPIVVISGSKTDDTRLEAIKCGAQDYVSKRELDAKVLPMTLRFAMERHHLQHTVEAYAQELRDKQIRLVEAQAIAQMGSWELDVFHMAFNWSAEALNILEQRPDKTTSTMQQFLDMVNNADQKTVREVFRQAIEEGKDFNIDIGMVMSDLTLKHINLRVRSSHERELNKKVILGTIQDITSRKKIEEALKKSEEKYHNLFEQSRDAIYITSRDGYFLDFNNATNELFGYSTEEMRTLNVKELYLNPFERVKFRKEIEEKGFVRDFELKLRRKDGSKIDCVITSSLWKSNDGKRLGYQGIIRDITEKRRTEELLKEKEVAERSAKLKEDFLANMSHEIRTPINAILGLNHLLSQTPVNNQQSEYLEGIRSSSEHLLELVNDILDFTKIEAGKVTFEKIDFSITSLLQQVVNTLRFKAHDKRIELLLEAEKDLPTSLSGDPLRLKQILINLVSNAVKFTNVGHVKIICRILEQTDSDVVLSFVVEDTGIGISEDKLHKIFASFTQLGYSVTKQAEGTGLGLTITKQLVELQGGTINVKSKVGEGSAFKVVLKYRKSDAPPKELEADGVTGAFTPKDIGYKRILIVEDKKLNQLVAKEIIQSWWPKVQVDVADNGKIAIDKINRLDFDIILMDVQMPEMDGYEATKYIREKFVPPTSDMPILAMTAYATTGEAQKCIDAGMNDYISKPFEPKALHDKIINLISVQPQATNGYSKAISVPEPPKEEPKDDEPEYIDMAYLNSMTSGNEALKSQLIGLLIEETPEELDILSKFTREANWTRVRGISHKMKSSATYMGLKKTLALLKQIEEYSGAAKNTDEIPEMVRIVSKNFSTAVESLKQKVEG